MDAAAALALTDQLVSKLSARQAEVQKPLNYYRGRVGGLRFASEQFSNYFNKRFDGFMDNWCAPVIQAPTERMNVLGVRVGDDRTVDADLARVWRSNDAEGGSSEAFVVGLAASRSFALVWGNPVDESTPRVTWESPASCIVGYDADTGAPVAGLKMWQDDTHEFATLYTVDEVWKWQRRRNKSSSGLLIAAQAGPWDKRQPSSDDTWPLPNPMGEVPLVELKNQTLLDDCPISDISGVMAMQDAINLVWAYLFNALDFASLPQRVVLGAEIPKTPVLDESGQVVGEKPVDIKRLMQDRILWVTDQSAQIGSWPAAQLDVFSKVVEEAVEHIGSQTRTPPHYLVGKLPQVAAETLTVAETGLVAKTRERIVYYTPGIRRIFRLIALAQGDAAKANAVSTGKVQWADPQYRSEAQKVDAFLKFRQAGLPIEWLLEWYGLPSDEVTRVLGMIEAEASDPTLERVLRGVTDMTGGAPAAGGQGAA